MFLRFTSDGSLSGRGFNASYSKGEVTTPVESKNNVFIRPLITSSVTEAFTYGYRAAPKPGG